MSGEMKLAVDWMNSKKGQQMLQDGSERVEKAFEKYTESRVIGQSENLVFAPKDGGKIWPHQRMY